MTNDDSEITLRNVLHHMQTMEAALLARLDDLTRNLSEHIDGGMKGLTADLRRLEGKVDTLIVRVTSINTRLGAVEKTSGDSDTQSR